MPTRKAKSTKADKTTGKGSRKTTRSSKRYQGSTVRAAANWAMNNKWLKEWGGWATSFSTQELIATAQKCRNIAVYVTKQVKKNDWVGKAREVTQAGVTDVKSFLNIPSQDVVDHLRRKVDMLEQRMNTVMLRRTPKR